MRHSVQTAMQLDYRGVLVVLESFFRELTDSRSHVDIVIAAGVAHESIRSIAGQERASTELAP